MCQKVHPYGFRLGFTKTWRSRWFAKQDYAKLLREDLELKDSLRDRLKAAGISSIEGSSRQQTADHHFHFPSGIIIDAKAPRSRSSSRIWPRRPSEVFIDIQEVQTRADAQRSPNDRWLENVVLRRAMRKAVTCSAVRANQARSGRRTAPKSRALNGICRVASVAYRVPISISIQPGLHLRCQWRRAGSTKARFFPALTPRV
jgi:hypothetical protein